MLIFYTALVTVTFWATFLTGLYFDLALLKALLVSWGFVMILATAVLAIIIYRLVEPPS